jgi:hypothetical protein
VAIFTGVLLISVGVAFFTNAGLLTGGTAGLAFLLHYATGIGFGKIFFVLNLPFYWLALRKLGRAFTLKTFIAVLLLSVLTEAQSQLLQFAQLQPVYAAVAGGLITGTGFLVLFRHRCSLGAWAFWRCTCKTATAGAQARCRWRGLLHRAAGTVDGGAPARGMVCGRCGGAEPGAGHEPPPRALLAV